MGEPLPYVANFVCAGLAACTAEALYGCPVNMCKIQMQLYRGNGLYGTCRAIIASEGVGGLWRGIAPSLHRQLVYGQLRIGIYNSFVDPSSGTGEKMILGVLSGSVSAAIANPFDLMLVRQQAEHSVPKQNRLYHMNSFDNMKLLKDELGLRGMFKRGVGPTVTRAAVVTCFEQATYTECKHFMMSSRFQFKDNIVTHLASSFVAGLIASIATCPIDVVKTHVMTTKEKNSSVIKKSLGLLRRPHLLYRGFIPYYLKVGPWAMVMFVAFEQYKRLYRVMSDHNFVTSIYN